MLNFEISFFFSINIKQKKQTTKENKNRT